MDRLTRSLSDAGELIDLAAEESDNATAQEIEADFTLFNRVIVEKPRRFGKVVVWRRFPSTQAATLDCCGKHWRLGRSEVETQTAGTRG